MMIDCSKEEVQGNITKTNEVIRAAHVVGVSVEAEVGELERTDEIGERIVNKNLASVDDVQEFVAGGPSQQ